MPHHMRGRHKVFHSSPAPKRPLGERLSDGLSRVVRGLFWLGMAYVAMNVFFEATKSINLPNGAVLGYRPDLTYQMTINLFRPGEFRPVVHAVDQICYNQKAIWVSTLDYKAYVWPSLAADPLPASSKRYFQALKQSGLLSKNYTCNGYYPTSLDAGFLVEGLCPMIPRIPRQGRSSGRYPGHPCDATPLPLAWPDEDPSAKR